jgi:hypothetical protein
VTIQEPTHVTSCSNLLTPILLLFSNSRSAGMSFAHLQSTFIVKYCLTSLSYLTRQNKFRVTFLHSSVPNDRHLIINRFRDTGTVQDRDSSSRPSVLSDDSLDDIRQNLLRSLKRPLRKLSLMNGLFMEVYIRLQRF